MRSHAPGGGLIHDGDIKLPSDIDLSLIFKRKNKEEKVTIGDGTVLSRRVREALEDIYDVTRVFISAHDADPMVVKSVDEVIEQLQDTNTS